jgi:hypothetical protein
MEWWKATGICAAFFLALSPGFLLTLPPVSGSQKGLLSKGLIHSLETSNASIIAHTIVFLFLVGGLLWYLDSGSRNSREAMPTVDDSSNDEGDASEAEVDNEGE